MSANLFNGRYAGKQPAWHGQGTVDETIGQLTATEAVSKYRLDVKYEKAPIWIPYAGGTITSPQMAIVREPTPDDNQPRVLGYVDEKFGLLQNLEIAGILDPLTEKMPVETCGLLGKGETFWLMLNAGEAQIAGEDVAKYFSIVDFKAGQGRLRAVFTPVRMVCQNTVEMGLAAASVDVAFNHHEGIAQDLEWTANLMAAMTTAGEFSLDALEKMAQTKVTLKDAQKIIGAAFPLRGKSGRVKLFEELNLRQITAQDAPAVMDRLSSAAKVYDRENSRLERFQLETMELFSRINDEHSAIAGSVYAAYNAVCEHIDHRDRPGRQEDVLVGAGRSAKLRSFKVAAGLCHIPLGGQPSRN